MNIEPLGGAQSVQSLAGALKVAPVADMEQKERIPDSESMEMRKSNLQTYQGTKVDITL